MAEEELGLVSVEVVTIMEDSGAKVVTVAALAVADTIKNLISRDKIRLKCSGRLLLLL